jgi:LuxR family transcriptional regulator, maltose regulon positive regulatory protein
VLDYLAEEVLARQPEDLVGFLLETSILERLSGPLCDAVTGRADSQQLLEQAERANLFLVPLDEVRGWWRYHQLFADLLQARLERERPDRVAELHRSAAAWSERHGLADDAIRHAVAAEEGAWAARLIEQHFDAVFRRAEDATLRRWLRALPAELARARPRLCLADAYWAVVIDGRLQTAERLLEDAERALAAGTDEPYQPSVGRAASLVANVPAAIAVLRARVARLCGDPEHTIAFGQQALADLTDADRALRAELDWYLAAADWLGGRLLEAERALADLVARQQAAGERYLAIWPRYELGQALQAHGQLGAALRTFEQALEVASDPDRALPAAGIAHVGMAEVLYQRSELDAALRHATDGIGLCRQLAYGLPLAIGLATFARIRQAQGDQAGALQAIREAERVMPGPEVTSLLNPVPSVAARLLLAHGRIAEAARWAAERGLDVSDEPSYPRERDHLVLARVLLAEQAPERTLGLVARLHTLAAAQGRTGSLIEIQALQAVALHAAGDQAAALGTLAEALTLGAPEGYLRVFLDEGPPMAALLHQLLASRRRERLAAAGAVPRPYLARLVETFEQAGLPIHPPVSRGGVVVAGLVEPLTARELEVLQLLAARAPNRSIAQQLVVTPETVKKHLSHLFDKLGAANRTQAVARARELGLVS